MVNEIIEFLGKVEASFLYQWVLLYVGLYPMFGAVMWTTTSIFYYLKRERSPEELDKKSTYFPKVSVLIAAYNEEIHIRTALDSACALNYPDFEIVVVNDGSTDKTLDILNEYVAKDKIRLITKDVNQGKAIALNDASMCLEGDIILYMDADAEIEPDALQYLVPPFQNARVAAVAGNPRVKNADNFLCRMQILEYATIIGTIRRAQRVWGRIMTFSGVIFALRKNALFAMGGFDTNAPTEDIDLTWRLQKNFWDVFYEPRAVAWIVTPDTYKGFIKQRLRWARGLMYVIGSNIGMLFSWRTRRMWPVIIENLMSQFWVLSAIVLFILWVTSLVVGYTSLGISFFPPLAWGVCIGLTNIVSQIFSIFFDKKYDPQLTKYLFYTVYFPLYYWVFLAIIAFVELPRLFFKPKPTLGWKHAREK